MRLSANRVGRAYTAPPASVRWFLNSVFQAMPETMLANETAQQRFDRTYITAAEICAEMGVNRTTVLAAKKSGLLPDPVLVNDRLLCLWERAKVRPYIDAWKLVLSARRGKPEGAPA